MKFELADLDDITGGKWLQWENSAPERLPSPFTLEQFKKFCEAHPFFQWEAIDSIFTNDNGSLDKEALTELEKHNANAEALVRYVIGATDDEHWQAWKNKSEIADIESEIEAISALAATTISEKHYQDTRLRELNAEIEAKQALAQAATLKANAAQEQTATPQAAQDAPVVAEPDPLPASGLLPLTTGDIAHAFDGLRWNEAQWKKPLGDKPKWLAGCIAIPGKQGVSETRWNPVLIAAELVRQDYVKAFQVRAKFQNVHQLKPWLDAWKTYEADTFDTP